MDFIWSSGLVLSSRCAAYVPGGMCGCAVGFSLLGGLGWFCLGFG